ncbi:hypothetical protein Salat_2641100 [Sesamum alatum]|uniref:Uncharacterized protein n=1 Tax=Sesamum alatum TaxID=300844 RepID=A0AAE2CAU9_9LAMI|nr:hypothetical protein Salat_2641100 [Sesamum alatum]
MRLSSPLCIFLQPSSDRISPCPVAHQPIIHSPPLTLQDPDMAIFITLPVISCLFFLILAVADDVTNSTTAPPPSAAMAGSRISSFKPGIAVTVGILTTVFLSDLLVASVCEALQKGQLCEFFQGLSSVEKELRDRQESN